MEPKADEPLGVEVLTKGFKDSKDDLKAKYQGKEVTVSGFVDRKAYMISETSGGAMMLVGSGESKDTIRCSFDSKDSAVFLAMVPHSPRTVKGIVDVGSEVELKFCKFVE